MMKVEAVRRFRFTEMETLVFAGGGNRCWWQAGVLHRWMDRGMRLPGQMIGTSAGAAVAASCVLGDPNVALNACLRLYAQTPRIFHGLALPTLKLKFAHQHVYPDWVDAFLNAKTFATLRNSSSRLTVALTRPARLLGMSGSIAAGTLAYLVDKYVWNSIHPRLPRMFGLRQDFVVLNDCADIAQAQTLLIAAASAPPIMLSRVVGAGRAIDGGYTDNAPIPPQSTHERSKTLVLLTRHYPKLPTIFHWQERTYWQPSRRVPVSTWDCTAKTTVREAYELGLEDSVSVFGKAGAS